MSQTPESIHRKISSMRTIVIVHYRLSQQKSTTQNSFKWNFHIRYEIPFYISDDKVRIRISVLARLFSRLLVALKLAAFLRSFTALFLVSNKYEANKRAYWKLFRFRLLIKRMPFLARSQRLPCRVRHSSRLFFLARFFIFFLLGCSVFLYFHLESDLVCEIRVIESAMFRAMYFFDDRFLINAVV